jgi:hypothetical protein
MPVFLSHRTADDSLAQTVAHRLIFTHQIECYLDDVDKQANKPGAKDGITSLIVRRVNECTNLLALVTPNTQGSWWVPFEVGVARQAPRAISTYTSVAANQLPEYLTEWPVLRGENGIDKFAYYYKLQQAAIRTVLKDKTASASALSAIDTFHKQLRTALGQ